MTATTTTLVDEDQLFVIDPSVLTPLKTMAVQKAKINSTSYEVATFGPRRLPSN